MRETFRLGDAPDPADDGREVIVRHARPLDRRRCVEIDALSFPRRWPARYFERLCARGGYVHGKILRVATLDGFGVAGFVVHGVYPGSLDGEGCLGVARLAVHPDCRRRGIGRLLLDAVACRLSDDFPHLVAEVRLSNLGAIAFLRAMRPELGWELQPDAFDEPPDDGILFIRHFSRGPIGRYPLRSELPPPADDALAADPTTEGHHPWES